jgi:hypothetical protein
MYLMPQLMADCPPRPPPTLEPLRGSLDDPPIPYSDDISFTETAGLATPPMSGYLSESITRKRDRFKIKTTPGPDAAKWSVLMEAIRLDFVRKGPDSVKATTVGYGTKRQPNEADTLRIIDRRYRMIFGINAPPMDGKQLHAVSSCAFEMD